MNIHVVCFHVSKTDEYCDILFISQKMVAFFFLANFTLVVDVTIQSETVDEKKV